MPRTRDREDLEWEEEQASIIGLNFWRLCDEVTVLQAALLIVGCDPGGTDGYAEAWDMHKRPAGYEAAKVAIANALRRDRIKGQLIPMPDYDMQGNQCGYIADSVNVADSRVEVDSLKDWLVSRGIRTGFFFPIATDAPDYLDRQHPRYAPKLAAAVRAWQAIDDPKGKTPKQALVKWLREHGAEFDLSDEEGKPNEQGIEECAKVANWQLLGGAPKTPGP